jgi:hypothetical protein
MPNGAADNPEKYIEHARMLASATGLGKFVPVITKRGLGIALALCLLAACSAEPTLEDPLTVEHTADADSAAPAQAPKPQNMNEIAKAYVELVLKLGRFDADYVDAYYGPPEWKTEAEKNPLSLPQIEQQAQELIVALINVDNAADAGTDEQLLNLRKSARLLQGEQMSFDDEARALYDVEPPHYSESDFAPVLKIMDSLLPAGPGTLAQRYNQYIEQFSVPAARLETVMRTAIGVSQYRSAAHLKLPPGERFDLVFVSGKPWSAYNWYQGNYVSRIEVNTDLPIPISRVIELAAHEGYPGHHVYNSLLEQALVRGRGWPEYQVYALFSPQSFIAEGTADFGVGMVYPGNERLEFARELFQIAGLDIKQAANYLQVVDAAKALAPATIEAARRYVDGQLDDDSLVAWLQRYTLASPARATQRLAFIKRYRSYIINYSYGEELVRDFVEREGDKTPGSAKQWQAFSQLLTTPRTPTTLQAAPLPLLPAPPEATSIAISAADTAEPAPQSDRLQPAAPLPLKLSQDPAAIRQAAAAMPAPASKEALALPKKTDAAKPPAKASAKPAAKTNSKTSPKKIQNTSLRNSADFKSFLATKPTPAQFHKRYPKVALILFGAESGKSARTDDSRFFAQLDDNGHIVGGKFR